MQRILMVEDSLPCLNIFEAALASPDRTLVRATSVAEVAQLTASDNDFSLVLLDRVLPDGDGLNLMRSWKDTGKFRGVPVLMISADEDVEAKISAFSLGAEDYMIKPIHPRELRARVDLRLRQAVEHRPTVENIRRGCLLLNFTMMRASLIEGESETPIDLTAKEFRLIATLVSHEGQTFTRPQLVKAVWGTQMHVVNRTVDSHICGARRKLGPAGVYIRSIPGEGYRFSLEQ